MHDAVWFETNNMPAVFVATDEFIDSAVAQSTSLGLPEVPRVYIPHPMQDQTDEEMLEAYKIIARTEGICSALEPMAAAAEVIFRQAKNKPKDYTICLSLCGRGEKDLDTIQEHIGKDFE